MSAKDMVCTSDPSSNIFLKHNSHQQLPRTSRDYPDPSLSQVSRSHEPDARTRQSTMNLPELPLSIMGDTFTLYSLDNLHSIIRRLHDANSVYNRPRGNVLDPPGYRSLRSCEGAYVSNLTADDDLDPVNLALFVGVEDPVPNDHEKIPPLERSFRVSSGRVQFPNWVNVFLVSVGQSSVGLVVTFILIVTVVMTAPILTGMRS